MVKGDKERFTKLISISMGKPLIARGWSGLLTIIAVVIRDEIISYGFACDHLFIELSPHML
jgi:hypothetical protein